MAAETRQARAEERVAPKMPAVIRGAKPDTMLMVCRDKELTAPRMGDRSLSPHLGHLRPHCGQGLGLEASI